MKRRFSPVVRSASSGMTHVLNILLRRGAHLCLCHPGRARSGSRPGVRHPKAELAAGTTRPCCVPDRFRNCSSGTRLVKDRLHGTAAGRIHTLQCSRGRQRDRRPDRSRSDRDVVRPAGVGTDCRRVRQTEDRRPTPDGSPYLVPLRAQPALHRHGRPVATVVSRLTIRNRFVSSCGRSCRNCYVRLGYSRESELGVRVPCVVDARSSRAANCGNRASRLSTARRAPVLRRSDSR